ncbi:MAG TPA: class I SAM-dependent methyltransferase [Candidatus Aphodovivens avicola]|nr:class I SAM-dependent methyltransferase [Candidatus Aphodovivens avicola]
MDRSDEREFFASCLAGMEQLIAEDLRTAGARRVRPLTGGVAFFVERKDVLAACLESRFVSRLTMVLGRIDASDDDALYRGMRAFPWASLIKEGATFSVRAKGGNEQLRNTKFIALKAKDAIVDAVRVARGTRPDVDVHAADVRIEIIVRGAKATVSLVIGRGRFETPAHLANAEAAQAHARAVEGCSYRLISLPDSAGGPDIEVPVLDEHADQFAARLRKNFKERRKWAARNEISCYRIYDADLPDFSVAIDVYTGVHEGEEGTFLHIAEYAAPASVDPDRAQRRFEDVLAISPVVCGVKPAHAFSKVRKREKGGARSTLTVDLSQTYLDWARRNMALNGFDGPEDRFERADAVTWVSQARRAGMRFDLVFVDPPTFSNSKSMGKRTWDVQRDHAELLIGVSRLLSEEGVAVFSCNLRSFKPDLETLEKYGVEIEDITAETIPHDFERNPKIHHCYLVRRAR